MTKGPTRQPALEWGFSAYMAKETALELARRSMLGAPVYALISLIIFIGTPVFLEYGWWAVAEALLLLSLGAVRVWFWSDGWKGARRWMRRTVSFVHRRAPGLRVTVSSGHHTWARDVLRGRFDGVGLDFLDVHVYTNGTRIPHGAALARHARRRGIPIVVGEFGQKKEGVDTDLQARVTRGILSDAKRLGFRAVFAWRLEDQQAHSGIKGNFGQSPAFAPVVINPHHVAGLNLTPCRVLWVDHHPRRVDFWVAQFIK